MTDTVIDLKGNILTISSISKIPKIRAPFFWKPDVTLWWDKVYQNNQYVGQNGTQTTA